MSKKFDDLFCDSSCANRSRDQDVIEWPVTWTGSLNSSELPKGSGIFGKVPNQEDNEYLNNTPFRHERPNYAKTILFGLRFVWANIRPNKSMSLLQYKPQQAIQGEEESVAESYLSCICAV